jgi:hypothetical protein
VLRVVEHATTELHMHILFHKSIIVTQSNIILEGKKMNN